MNKRNKILIGCLALLLALSVGYALFSETITINGTATAKGDFDIGVTCQTGLANITGIQSNTVNSLNRGPVVENSFSGDTCTASNNTVTFDVNLNAPGAMRYYTIKATNNGTIDAWASIATIATREVCMGNDMKKIVGDGYSGFVSCRNLLFNKDDGISSNKGSINFETLSFVYIIEKADGTFINLLEMPEEEAMAYLSDDGEQIKLPSGYSVYYVGKMYIPEDYKWNQSGGSEVNMIDFDLSANYIIDFIQQTN